MNLSGMNSNGSNAKRRFAKGDIFILTAVSVMSLVSNLPEHISGNLVDRKLLLSVLIAIVVIAMFRYLKVLLLLIISILAVGANLPGEIAQALGVSQFALLVALGCLVAVTILNRVLKLLPTEGQKEEGSAAAGSPLSELANPRQFLLLAISKGNIAIIRELLTMNAEINFALDGTTPLHLAAEKGYAEIVQLLLDNGADHLAVNAEGKTPLDIALEKKFVRTTEMLFNAHRAHE